MNGGRDIVVCFSGHRYYGGAPDDEMRLAAAIRVAFDDGYRVFVSGMAPGFDLAAAEAVVRLRERNADNRRADNSRADKSNADSGLSRPAKSPDIRLIAAIPFAAQAAGYSVADRLRYDSLLAVADEVRVLAAGYSHGCYFRRDDWMVEHSNRIVCWYDGSASGTRYTVRRALAHGLEVVNTFRAADSLF